MILDKKITFVMTSCNRFDLLKPTLDSFLKFNTYPIDHYIFIEDTKKIKQLETTIKQFPEVYKKSTLLFNEPKLGQIKSIDRAYSHVKTKYIFHCEEDWEFYNKGFIENSITVLENNSKIINVWLRELNDTNKHPVENEVFKIKDIACRMLKTNHLNSWHGFTFNPAVKRLSDYKKLGQYQAIGHEAEIGDFYYNLDYKACIFTSGYVKHLGWHRRVLDADKKRSKLLIEVDSFIKKQKAKVYKKLGIFGKKYK